MKWGSTRRSKLVHREKRRQNFRCYSFVIASLSKMAVVCHIKPYRPPKRLGKILNSRLMGKWLISDLGHWWVILSPSLPAPQQFISCWTAHQIIKYSQFELRNLGPPQYICQTFINPLDRITANCAFDATYTGHWHIFVVSGSKSAKRWLYRTLKEKNKLLFF